MSFLVAADPVGQLVAREALRYVVEDAGLGVGSGSTVNYRSPFTGLWRSMSRTWRDRMNQRS
ncbi:MAG TPA: hypothetical protein VKV24_03230 [Casimicrobiaceae bacterium]|nr:hypothetical protein [Casimicrobiaceae bacterium]